MNKELSNKISVIAKRLAVAVIVVCCFFPFCACSGNIESGETLNASERNKRIANNQSNKKVHEAITTVLGFDIADEYIDEAEMTTDTITANTYGKIRVIIKKGNENEVLQLFMKKFGDYQNIDASLIPDYQNHPYAYELKHMHSIKHWAISKDKNVINPINIDIFIAELNGDTIIYIFG